MPTTPHRYGQKPSRPTLIELYVNQRLTTAAIALQFAVSPWTIRVWMRGHGIDRRPMGRGLKRPPRDVLDDLYTRLTAVEVGRMFGVSADAVNKWRRHYTLPNRKQAARNQIDTSPVVQRYLAGEEVETIIKTEGIRKKAVYRALRRAGIEPNRHPVIDHAKVRRLLTQGVKPVQVAKRMAINCGPVWRIDRLMKQEAAQAA